MENENSFATPKPRPFWDRWIQRFYGYHQPWPFFEQPSGVGVCMEVATVFGWKDRLRILLGGVVWTKLVIDCKNDPGKVTAHTVVFIQRPANKPTPGGLRGFE